MNVKKRPDFEREDLGINPFIVNNYIKARSFNKETTVVIKTEEGINLPSGHINNNMLVEEQSSTKIYHDTQFRDRILGLDETCLKLLFFIMYQLKPNEDFIWINSRLFQNSARIRDKRKYTDAVSLLSRYGFIYLITGYTDLYWINPLVFFSGNRLKMYPDNLTIR